MLLNCGVESPWDCKEIQPVHPKGDQSWVFTGRTDVEAETPILWPPDAKSWLIWKDTDAGKDWKQEEKGTTEDEMVGWHHWLNGHGFGWTLSVGDGKGGLVCCGSWSHKKSDITERLNCTEYWEGHWQLYYSYYCSQGISWSLSVEQSKDYPLWTLQPQPLLLHCKTLDITILLSLRTLFPAPGTSAKWTSPASAVLLRLLKRIWSNFTRNLEPLVIQLELLVRCYAMLC